MNTKFKTRSRWFPKLWLPEKITPWFGTGHQRRLKELRFDDGILLEGKGRPALFRRKGSPLWYQVFELRWDLVLQARSIFHEEIRFYRKPLRLKIAATVKLAKAVYRAQKWKKLRHKNMAATLATA
ncbi:MAG: hypothetical protein LBH01_01025 [Verrucomicrobiales bacterium]|jgi:hypothetical protein|nr:hypothetical protein [Verrucomicrobiales bacterium]